MSYNIPRNVKGEGRILYIFSYKALMYTGIGVLIGVAINFILSLFGLDIIGYIIIGVLGFIGFGIGTFKMPNLPFLKSARLAAGEQIDEVIKRAIKFKMNKDKLYIYTSEQVAKEEKKNEKKTEDKEGGKKNGR